MENPKLIRASDILVRAELKDLIHTLIQESVHNPIICTEDFEGRYMSKELKEALITNKSIQCN